MILAFDTSSALSSVALVDRGNVVAEERHRDARRHAEVLAPMTQRVLSQCDTGAITTVACGVGPGPYTGLRVAIASAIAMGAAWDVPVVGICSLDAIAESVMPGEPFGVCSDARRKEVYWAVYGPGGDRLEGPLVSPAAALELRGLPWFGHGLPALTGDAYADAVWVARRVERLQRDGVEVRDVVPDLVAHGQSGDAAALAGHALLTPRPLYVRRPDAMEPARAQVTGR